MKASLDVTFSWFSLETCLPKLMKYHREYNDLGGLPSGCCIFICNHGNNKEYTMHWFTKLLWFQEKLGCFEARQYRTYLLLYEIKGPGRFISSKITKIVIFTKFHENDQDLCGFHVFFVIYHWKLASRNQWNTVGNTMIWAAWRRGVAFFIKYHRNHLKLQKIALMLWTSVILGEDPTCRGQAV